MEKYIYDINEIMSAGDVPEPLLKQFETVLALCERYNVPPGNLRRGEFTPDDLKEEYDELQNLSESYSPISPRKMDKFLAKKVELDETRKTRYYLWDIAVEKKDGIVSETYPCLDDLGYKALLD